MTIISPDLRKQEMELLAEQLKNDATTNRNGVIALGLVSAIALVVGAWVYSNADQRDYHRTIFVRSAEQAVALRHTDAAESIAALQAVAEVNQTAINLGCAASESGATSTTPSTEREESCRRLRGAAVALVARLTERLPARETPAVPPPTDSEIAWPPPADQAQHQEPATAP